MKYPALIVALALSVLPATSVYATAQHTGAAHWGYTGSAGPSAWGKFALCGSGKRQSPVDIQNEKSTDLYPVHFQSQPVLLRVISNGHTLQANYDTVNVEEDVDIGGKSHPMHKPGVSQI